ncbi:MAG: isoprenylcysteine carboxylmethyltransferase family protein [Candidatus Limnocylindrales bacterium]
MLLQVVLLPLVALAGVVSGGAWQGTPASISALVGLAAMVGGALLLGRGLLDLGRNLTPVPRPREDAQLVETGIYALVRHPIYGGIIVTAFGWGLLAASPLTLALALVVAVFFDLKSRREEAWLAAHYAGYRTYVSRTRRFVPRIY